MNYLLGRRTPICRLQFWHHPWTLHKMNSVLYKVCLTNILVQNKKDNVAETINK